MEPSSVAAADPPSGITPTAHPPGSLPGSVIASITGLCALWGLGQVMIKVGNAGISPLMQAGLRSAGAAVLVALWMRWRGTSMAIAPGRLGPIVIIGVLFAAEFVFLFQGLGLTTASRGTLLLYTAPFVVALGGHLLLGDRLDRRQWLGLLLAFAGLVVVMSSRPSIPAAAVPSLPSLAAAAPLPGASTLVGDLMCLAGGVFWALTTLVIRSTSLRHEQPDRCLFFQLAGSAPLLIGLSWLLGAERGEPGVHALTPAVLGALAYQVFVIASASYLAWFHLILRYSPGRLSAFTFLTPLFGVLFAAPLLKEPLYPGLILALALCMAGLWLVNQRRR